MTGRFKAAVRGFVVIAAAAAGWLIFRSWQHAANQPASKPDSEGVAVVTTAVIRSGQVSQTATVYGQVTAQPGAINVLSVPIECRVKHLRVSAGENIASGTAIIEVEPSPDAKLALIDARNLVQASRRDAAAAHQRVELKLATNADAQTADQVVQSAQAKFDDLMSRGAGQDVRTILSGDPAIVAKIDVQEGQLVPAGAALVELLPHGRIEVRLGVEPTDAMSLQAGQPMQVFPIGGDDDEPAEANIRLVTHRINPDSRLVDIFALPAEADNLLLDSFIRGNLTLKTVSGLVIPHDALLPGDDGFSIFTVVAGHAIRHAVKVAVQNDKEAVVTGSGLHEGDIVVVGGNLELDDNAAVNATAATTAPADAEVGK